MAHFFNGLLDGLRVIAPDLLGQGGTEVPVRGRIDFDAYLHHVTAFLDGVAPPTFHLLQHDFGGMLGLTWALAHRERIRSLVLLSTTVTPSRRIAVLYAANLIFGRALLRRAMPWPLKRAKLDENLARSWSAPWTRRRLLRGADHFGRAHLRAVRERLGELTMPTLVIWGEQDDVFPIRHAHAIASALPTARLATIARCGHWSPLDAAPELARLIREHCRAS